MSTAEQTRAELLKVVAELGHFRPEWRLGQTLANIAMTAGRHEPAAVWNMEDEEALAAARKLLRECEQVERASA
jgi:hypothetical protein